MSRYSQLFSIEVRHSFFSSGLCSHLEFVPTPKTAGQIINAGLLCKESKGGVRVFYDLERLDSLRLHAADQDEPLNLVFKAYARDPLFMNYTQGDSSQDDGVRYFDSSNAVRETEGGMRLHADEYAGSGDYRPLDSPGLQGVLTSTDQLVRPTFVVNIGVPQEAANALGGDANEVSLNYFVSFQERQTFWKYFLMGEFARDGLYVADLDNSTEFESSGTQVLADERTAFTFVSKTSLPMRERSEYRFQLRERGSGNEKVLIRRLPVASAAQIGVERTDSRSALVSEMYINS